jgi:hypothetical protein
LIVNLLWRGARHDGGPLWVTKLLDRFRLTNLGHGAANWPTEGAYPCQSGHHYRPNHIRGHHETFVMRYLLFFLLRSGWAGYGQRPGSARR